MINNLELTAADVAPAAVSRGRPEFFHSSPRPATCTSLRLNCFQSWMTELNDILAEHWKHPVFIANEGWGGDHQPGLRGTDADRSQLAGAHALAEAEPLAAAPGGQ